jgi:glutamate-1-semialdehyde 2,1-aminomutase
MFSIFFGLKKVRSKEDLKNLNHPMFHQFFRFLFEKGIYIPPSSEEAWFVSSVHTEEHLNYTKEVILDFLNNLK